MRIGVISDSHGNITKAKHAIDLMGKVHLIFHLGDYIRDVEYLQEETKTKIIAIKGNMDFHSGTNEKIISIENKKIFITHGHSYKIKNDKNRLFYKALEIEADIVLFGHTHKPYNKYHQGILFFNPGSVGDSRWLPSESYGIIEILENEIKSNIYNI